MSPMTAMQRLWSGLPHGPMMVSKDHAVAGSMPVRVTCAATRDHGDVWAWAAAEDQSFTTVESVSVLMAAGPYYHQRP